MAPITPLFEALARMSDRLQTSADVARLHELRERCLTHRQTIGAEVSEKLSLPSKLLRHPLLTAGATTAIAMFVAPLALRTARSFRGSGKATSLLRGAGGGWASVAGLVAAPLIDIALQSALKWLQEREPTPKSKQLELLPAEATNHEQSTHWSRF